MKTDIQTSHSEQEGLIDVNAKEAGISSKDLASALSTLSERLYQDPISAILREITSNAVDANKDNNATKNVEVMVTSAEDDYFLTVKDYGKGMSESFMWDNYLQYFDSTKRNSNEMIGGFGIGSKSPFAYTDSFYIETKCLGEDKKRIYLFYKNEKNIPSLVLQETEEAPFEEEGTTIRIPLTDRDDAKKFSEVAFRTLFGFPNITSNIFESPFNQAVDFINTKEYLFFPVFHRCLEGIQHESSFSYTHRLNILLGDVLYQIDVSKQKGYYSDLLKSFASIPYMFLRFGIGELLPNPSRESIKLTEESVEVIANKIKSVLLEYSFFILDKLKHSKIRLYTFHVDLPKIIGFSTVEELEFLNGIYHKSKSLSLKVDNQDFYIPYSVISSLFSYHLSDATSFCPSALIKEIFESGDEETRKCITLVRHLLKNSSKENFLHNEFIAFDLENLSNEQLQSSLNYRYYLYMVFTGFVMSSFPSSNFSEFPKIYEINSKLKDNWEEFYLPENKKEFRQISVVENWNRFRNTPLFLRSDINGLLKTAISACYNKGYLGNSYFQVLFNRNPVGAVLKNLNLENEVVEVIGNSRDISSFIPSFPSGISIIDDKELSFIGSWKQQFEYLRSAIHSCFSRNNLQTVQAGVFRKGFLERNYAFNSKKSFVELFNKKLDTYEILKDSKLADLFVCYLNLLPEILFRTPYLLSDVLSLSYIETQNFSFSTVNRSDFYESIEQDLIGSFNQQISQYPTISSDPSEARKDLANILRDRAVTNSDLLRLKRKFYVNKYALKNYMSAFALLVNTQNRFYSKKYIDKICNTYGIVNTPEEEKNNLETAFSQLKLKVKEALEIEAEKQRLEKSSLEAARLEFIKERKKREAKEIIPVEKTNVKCLYLDTPTQSSIALKKNSSFVETLETFIKKVDDKDFTKKAFLAEKEPNYFLYCLPEEVERVKDLVNTFQFVYTSYQFVHYKESISLSGGYKDSSSYYKDFFNSIFVLNEEQIYYLETEEAEFAKNLFHFDKFIFTVHPFFTMQLYTFLKHDELIRDYSNFSKFIARPFEKLRKTVPRLQYHNDFVYPVRDQKIIGAVPNEKYSDSKIYLNNGMNHSNFKNEVLFTQPYHNVVEKHQYNKKLLETLHVLIYDPYTPDRFSSNWLYGNVTNLKKLVSSFNLHIDYMYFKDPAKSDYYGGYHSKVRTSFCPNLDFINEELIYPDAIITKELGDLYLDMNRISKNGHSRYSYRPAINDNVNDLAELSGKMKLFFLEIANAYNVYTALGGICLTEEEFENSLTELKYALSVTEIHYDAYLYLHKLCKMIDKTYKHINSDLSTLSSFIMMDGSIQEKEFTKALTNERYIHRKQKFVLSERHVSNFLPEYSKLIDYNSQKSIIKINHKDNPLFPQTEGAEKIHVFEFYCENISLNAKKRSMYGASVYKTLGNASSYEAKVEEFLKNLSVECTFNLKNAYIDLNKKLLFPLIETKSVGFSNSDIYNCSLTNDYEFTDKMIKRNYTDGSLIKVVYFKGLEAKQKYLKSLKEGDFNKYANRVVKRDDFFYNLSNLDSSIFQRRKTAFSQNAHNTTGVFKNLHRSNLIPTL
jgi:hypothetical protein